MADFYRRVLSALTSARIPFLVGGAFAHACHTGIRRATKDLDLFIRRADYERIARVALHHGWQADLVYPHWLAKIRSGPQFIDLIFNSGNGLAPVDKHWFHANSRTDILDVRVRIANVEDVLLSKAFLMERERFDGGDVVHLLQTHAERIDWERLLARFGPHWRVLLVHLILYGYIYPGERHRIPGWAMRRLTAHLSDEIRDPPTSIEHVCRGTFLSREQYLYDIEQLGYRDARLARAGSMTKREVAEWTQAIPAEHVGHGSPNT
ncbi:nucleotidyltransferase [Variovorax sp. HW608]|uniref:nucleotidyltransferase n=1 Tax=Variovorax sp. HW608 TaxID=1034889 RepID=UPI001E653E0A|nr:nucleotidyltransferase [Variovorax sp. HW608]